MTDVVRIVCDGRWAYVPLDDAHRRHLGALGSHGLTKAAQADIQLRSEAGPLVREMMPSSQADTLAAAAALTDDGVNVSLGQLRGILSFGEGKAAIYNPTMDMALKLGTDSEDVLSISQFASEGDIVVLAWPGKKRLSPAKLHHKGYSWWVESVGPIGDDRCFVLSEDTSSVLSASISKSGFETKVGIYRPGALVSWMTSVTPGQERFSISDDGARFLIKDARSGGSYFGVFRHQKAKDPQWFEFEWEELVSNLRTHGLGGVLSRYELRRVREGQ